MKLENKKGDWALPVLVFGTLLIILGSIGIAYAINPDRDFRSSGGIGLEVKTAALNSSTYTAITFTSDTKSVMCQVRTAIDAYLATSASPTHYWTIKSGSTVSLDTATFGAGNVLYLKSASGTPTAECIGLR